MDRTTIATIGLALIAVVMVSFGAALLLPDLARQRADGQIIADMNAILAHVPPSRR